MNGLRKKIKGFPDNPGVYLIKDRNGSIIYVGKALSLRKRVRSYFTPTQDPKIRALTSSACDIEYIATDSQAEALILECNLIKKHRPRYNVSFRDDKKYPYIKIGPGPFPYISVTRNLKKNGSRYYGPYTSAAAVRKTVKLMKKLFMLRGCRKKIQPPMQPCLYHALGQCIAPCTGDISEEEYGNLVHSACLFLNGKLGELITVFSKEMKKESDTLNFEKAAAIRDRLEALRNISESQKMVSAVSVDEDYIAFAVEKNLACVGIFTVREGKVTGQEQFILEGAQKSSPSEILSSFITQHYMFSSFIPGRLFLMEKIDDTEAVIKWLQKRRNGRVRIHVPERGKKSELLSRLAKNSALKLSEIRSRRKEDAVIELKELLALELLPSRIESFDVSHTGGEEAVGSMVLFENGLPERNSYRRFKIKGSSTRDDLAMIAEIVTRRYRRILSEKTKLPDLILVDGGTAHIASASGALKKIGIAKIPVIGLAKQPDRIFLQKSREPALLPSSSGAYQLIRYIRDETHRFATTFHYRLRSKKLRESVLDNISGLGEKRKKSLMTHFKSVQAIRKAEPSELQEVEGIGPSLSQSIKSKIQGLN